MTCHESDMKWVKIHTAKLAQSLIKVIGYTCCYAYQLSTLDKLSLSLPYSYSVNIYVIYFYMICSIFISYNCLQKKQIIIIKSKNYSTKNTSEEN